MDAYEPKPYDSIYWVEVDRIKPNPFQPRKTFDEAALNSLAESIRQYGVLQPLTVTRKEVERPGEGIRVEYELIAGERRLRASKIAGLYQVPVVIRHAEETDRMKLELAIIENLQREDLNAIDRAKAFKQLADEFNLKHMEIAQRVGKSREYVSNTLRILLLPQDMQDALEKGDISEGHTRPLLMLGERPAEQATLFHEIVTRRLTVRDSEQLARRVAIDRVRKQDLLHPEIVNMERELTERLGTRVRIEKNKQGGKVLIEFFSEEDLSHLVASLRTQEAERARAMEAAASAVAVPLAVADEVPAAESVESPAEQAAEPTPEPQESPDLYALRNFSL